MRSAVVAAALVACSAPDRVVVVTDEPEVVASFLATIAELAATQNAVDGTDVPLPGCSLEIEGG